MSQKLPPGSQPTGDTSPTQNERTRPMAPDPSTRPNTPSQARSPHVSTGRSATPQTPPTGRRQPAVRPPTGPLPPARARRAKRATRSGFYLPLWSIGLMILAVLGIGAFVVAAAIALGGRDSVPASTPVIRIITAAPDENSNTFQLTPPPAEAGSRTIIGNDNAPQSLSLDGPTLPAVVITPTPVGITQGATVAVTGVDDQQLNVRDVAGVTGSSILFRADEGEQFIISDGPLQADGFTWWQIQDTAAPTRTGWAVSNYLNVVSLP